MKHIIVSSADIVTVNDLAAFIANYSQMLRTEDALAIAGALISDGWVSVIHIDPAPAP